MHLRHLVFIRFFLISALLLASWIVSRFSVLPLLPIASVIGLLAVVNLFALPRLSSTHDAQPTELALHLLIDIIAVAALAFYTGGVSNPFLSYILVPVCIAATVLSARYAWALSVLAITLYGLLLFWFQPIALFTPATGHHHASGMSVHMIGMWLNFALSAVLISFFIVRMTATVRLHQQELNALREEDLRNEQLIAVATQAAGTAHELGTPLATIKVLLGEISENKKVTDLIGKDLELLREQVSQCGYILQRLRQRADIDQLTNPPALAAREYCEQLLDHWQLLRPDVHTLCKLNENLASSQVTFHPTIEQAIINVLNNAADASKQGIEVEVEMNRGAECLLWKVRDFGHGLNVDTRHMIGKHPITTKPDGMGIGLFLTHASIQRYGGAVVHEAAKGGGTLTTITLPVRPA